MNNLSVIIEHLFPSALANGQVRLQDNSDGNGPYIKSWTLPDPQPTEQELLDAEPAALAAERVRQLTRLAAYEATRRGAALTNPLTGQPISTRTHLSAMREDAFVAQQYCDAALKDPNTPQSTKDAIQAVFDEKDRLMGVFLQIKADIEAGTISTEDGVAGDGRW